MKCIECEKEASIILKKNMMDAKKATEVEVSLFYCLECYNEYEDII